MKFVEVLVIACSVSSPIKCQEVAIAKLGEVTPFQCFRYGQVEVQKWTAKNPGWKIKKWKCGKPRLEA